MLNFVRRLVQQKDTAHCYGEFTVELEGEARVFTADDLIELGELIDRLQRERDAHFTQVQTLCGIRLQQDNKIEMLEKALSTPTYISTFQHQAVTEMYRRWATTGRFYK